MNFYVLYFVKICKAILFSRKLECVESFMQPKKNHIPDTHYTLKESVMLLIIFLNTKVPIFLCKCNLGYR